jgi:hypothetical protein
VLIDNGVANYFIILHDRGYVELAVLKDNVFYSAVIFQIADYSLLNPANSINVNVTRQLDEVVVSVNGKKYLTFPIEPIIANISLASEKSMSKFSDITLTENSVFRLFATRQDSTPISFSTQTVGSERSSLAIINAAATTDFAVVLQYLYNNQRQINLPSVGIHNNEIFQGWIVNSSQLQPNQEISITLENLQLSYGVTALSIAFTYAILLYAIIPSFYIRVYQSIKRRKKGRENE